MRAARVVLAVASGATRAATRDAAQPGEARSTQLTSASPNEAGDSRPHGRYRVWAIGEVPGFARPAWGSSPSKRSAVSTASVAWLGEATLRLNPGRSDRAAG